MYGKGIVQHKKVIKNAYDVSHTHFSKPERGDEGMREKDLPIDRSKHTVYTKNAKKCVWTLLRR